MSQKLGLSREGFQEWDFILSQNGASIDSMQSGMKTLTNSIDDLSKGGKKATEAFNELGLSQEDLAGKSQEEVFEMTIIALQGMDDATKRAAIANDLLGKSGQELAPLLNAGAESVDAMKKQAHDLGLVLKDDAIDAGVKFTDTMDQVKRMVGSLGTEIGVAFMPIIQGMLEWVIENMPTIQATMETVFGVVSEVVKIAVGIFTDNLLPIFTAVFKYVQDNWPTFQKTWETVFKGIVKVAESLWSLLEISVIPIIEFLWEVVKKTIPLLEPIFINIFGSIERTINGVVKTVQFFIDMVQSAVEAFKKFQEISQGVDKAQGGTLSGNLKQYTQPKVNGSHANGLSYVPFDGYVAELHKGERVLTAQEAKTHGVTININDAMIMDDYSVDKLMSKVVGRLNALGVR
jgi:hypothetical protein